MKNVKTRMFGFAMVATLAVLASNPAMAGNKLCKIDHSHFGVGSVKSDLISAKRDAVRAWENFTIAEYGGSWGKISYSLNAKMNCDKGRRGGYVCNIKANPCRDERSASNGETVLERMIAVYQR